MKNIFLIVFICFLALEVNAQTEYDGSELGTEIFAARAGSNGGTMGFGIKYAAILNKNFAVGPSIRYHYTWSFIDPNLTSGSRTSGSLYGGGVFAHARYKDALFGGVEFEVLKTPFNFGGPQQEFKPWVATLFIGGGFSKLYNKVRINLGIFYDVINANNSPFRPNYAIKINDPEGNVQRILPIIYRINFFFPLGNKSKEDK